MPVQQAFSDVDAAGLEAEVLWGSDAIAALEPLHAVRRELQASLYVYLSYKRGPRHDGSDAVERAERIVFGIPGDDGRDEYADRLSVAVVTAERYVRPHLKTQAVASYLLSRAPEDSLATGSRRDARRLSPCGSAQA